MSLNQESPGFIHGECQFTIPIAASASRQLTHEVTLKAYMPALIDNILESNSFFSRMKQGRYGTTRSPT